MGTVSATMTKASSGTVGRASEILAPNVEDLDFEQRRGPVRSKGGGDVEFVYWDTGTAHPAAPAAAPARRHLAHPGGHCSCPPQACACAPTCGT